MTASQTDTIVKLNKHIHISTYIAQKLVISFRDVAFHPELIFPPHFIQTVVEVKATGPHDKKMVGGRSL